jgi:hypothetical protein
MAANLYIRALAAAALCGLWALWPTAALACPDCAVGRIARGAVFDDDFAANLVMVLSPLVLLTGIVALLHRVDAAQTDSKDER